MADIQTPVSVHFDETWDKERATAWCEGFGLKSVVEDDGNKGCFKSIQSEHDGELQDVTFDDDASKGVTAKVVKLKEPKPLPGMKAVRTPASAVVTTPGSAVADGDGDDDLKLKSFTDEQLQAVIDNAKAEVVASLKSADDVSSKPLGELVLKALIGHLTGMKAMALAGASGLENQTVKDAVDKTVEAIEGEAAYLLEIHTKSYPDADSPQVEGDDPDAIALKSLSARFFGTEPEGAALGGETLKSLSGTVATIEKVLTEAKLEGPQKKALEAEVGRLKSLAAGQGDQVDEAAVSQLLARLNRLDRMATRANRSN